MKKRFMIMALILGLCTAVFCSGCLFRRPAPEENKVKFSAFTQEEKKDYINEYLWENYGFRGEITDVIQRQIGVFESEDHFTAYVSMPNKQRISIWISKKGEITDSMFLLDMHDSIYRYYETIVKEHIPDCKMRVYTDFLEKPSAELTEKDDIRTYLLEQPTSSNIRVFVNEDAGVEESVLDALEQKLGGIECTIFIYVCEDLDSVDVDSFELYSYTYHRDLSKWEYNRNKEKTE